VLELAAVYGAFLLAETQRRIYDALQDRVAAAFFSGASLFLVIAIGFVFVSTYRIFARQALEIRWRNWLTAHLIREWIGPHTCCDGAPAHRRGRAQPCRERVGTVALAALRDRRAGLVRGPALQA